jgi:hypothetical protein
MVYFINYFIFVAYKGIMNKTDDHIYQMRITYLAAVPHTLFTALVWLASGIINQLISQKAAIITFIVGGSFIFLGGELLKKLFHAPNLVSADNQLPKFFTLLAFTVPLSYPLIYLICISNLNLFYPAFMILIGAHYLPFVYGYGMKTFAVLSLLLVMLGTWFSLFNPVPFSTPAFATALILVAFAILHYFLIKNQRYEHA